MREHPCMTKARWQNETDQAYPGWRSWWNYTLEVRGELKFTGSFDACKMATGAFTIEPYEIRDCTGKSAVSNR
jgi:hypothetical protein